MWPLLMEISIVIQRPRSNANATQIRRMEIHDKVTSDSNLIIAAEKPSKKMANVADGCHRQGTDTLLVKATIISNF